MDNATLSFLKELIEKMSPSGYEGDSAAVWKKYLKKHADKIFSDSHGNSIACLNPKGKVKVMLAGHIDEIGYMIKYIDDNGYLYFSTVGGVDPHLIPGQRVRIKTSSGNILGVIGKKPIHCMTSEEMTKVSKIEDMWIDIGAKDQKAARKIVSIGDVAVPDVGFEALNGKVVIGRGFDDKAGAFVVAEVIKKSGARKFEAALYSVATVQEEIGLRGARTSAYGISPDVGIAVDVTFATDCPTMDKRKIGEIKIGAGPVIARGPNINPVVFNMLVDCAKKNKIPYQIEAISRGTGTDANAIQLTRSGVATGLISIPLRYMHTPVELLSTEDLDNAVKLICAFVAKINAKTSFSV